MNAFARGNVAAVQRRLRGDLQALRALNEHIATTPEVRVWAHTTRGLVASLEIALEDLENAVTLDEVTEERKTG